MSFVVSARKYRPSRFDEVVGQNHVSQTLKNALQNEKVAHAFLFCGPRGVGKTTCARILAKVLNCESPTSDMEACNECGSCSSFNENASFNIHELDAASNNSVDHIRALTDQVRFQPQQGKYKVYIIDEVHMLSQAAFNAFLKTLEEPPPYAIFILATTEKHKIIPTILSRCQIFDFKRISIPDIVNHLEYICKQEGINAERDALHIIAEKADGALRDGLSIFDRIVSYADKEISYNDVISNLNILDYDYYFKITDNIMTEDLSSLMLVFNEIIAKGFEPDIFINGLSNHFRNLLVCQDPSTLSLLEVGDAIKERYAVQAQMSSPSLLVSALSLANDCDVNYKMARNKRLHVEMCLIKMCYINRALGFSQFPKPDSNPELVALTEKKSPELSSVPLEPILTGVKQEEQILSSDKISVPSTENESQVIESKSEENLPVNKPNDTSLESSDKEHKIVEEETSKSNLSELDSTDLKSESSEIKVLVTENTSEPTEVENHKIEEIKEVSLDTSESEKTSEEVEKMSPIVNDNTDSEGEIQLETEITEFETSDLHSESNLIKSEESDAIEKEVEVVGEVLEGADVSYGSGSPISNGLTGLKKEFQSNGNLMMDTVSVTSLKSMEQEVEAEIKTDDQSKSFDFTQEELIISWDKYCSQVNSKSAKSYFESAEVVKGDEEIFITVGSQVAEGAIRNDGGIIEFLEAELQITSPKLSFIVDKSKMIEEPETKKPLSDKDKYQILREKNPLLDKLQKNFDLRLDI